MPRTARSLTRTNAVHSDSQTATENDIVNTLNSFEYFYVAKACKQPKYIIHSLTDRRANRADLLIALDFTYGTLFG